MRDEMTGSAPNRSDCGMVRPSALAVSRLITLSYFVGGSAGMSLGFIPFRILAMKTAARLYTEGISGP